MKKFLQFSVLMLWLVAVSCSKENNQGVTDPTLENKQPTGSSAAHFLQQQTFQGLVIEISYVQGFRPSQSAINNLIAFINKHCHKPAGIEVVENEIPSPGTSPYTITEILGLEDEVRTQYNTSNTLAMHILVLDGASAQDTGSKVTLGTAYRNTSMAIFQNTIINFSGSATGQGRIFFESAVLTHEFSHLLGLVNFGTPMLSDHQDEPNGNHCTTQNCLMNFQIEAGTMLLSSGLPELDALCLADLRANGGK